MPPRQAAIAEIGAAMQRYQRATQGFDDAVGRLLGLGPAELRCLDWLTDGPMTAGDLARAAGLRPAATTTLIDRLESKGFVRRTRSGEDRRRVMVELTEDGRARLWRVYGPLAAEGEPLLADLTVAELQTFTRLLAVMTASTERHEARVAAMSGDD